MLHRYASASNDRSAGRRRPPGYLALILVGLFASCVGGWALPAFGASSRVANPSQRLAVLLDTHQAYARPVRESTRLGLIRAKRPLTGEQTVLPVLGGATDAHGIKWLDVALPGRPNGHSGWIRKSGTRASTTPWRLVVDTSARRVAVYYDGIRVKVVEAIVGKRLTPTPLGRFFVEESIRLLPTDVGAPFALALSARSHVFQEFDGGPGQIALHGLTNVGGELGTAASHGCVRVADSSIRWLAARIGPGVPVIITR